MKRNTVPLFAILTLFTLLACAFLPAGCSSSKQDVRDITAAEADSLYTLYKGTPNFAMLDVRTPDEWGRARIEGSINIDQMADTFPDEIGKLDKTKMYILYCTDGSKRSVEASALMKKEGFRIVYQISGGVIAWALAGYPVVRISQTAPADSTGK